MKKNKSTTKNNYKVNRQNLINRISEAMNLKYGNYFSSANYDNNSLKKDIDKLINTQYYSKDPREVFTPIESNILDIVKRKNPDLQIKVKKARKLPEIKYTKDKYQEADKCEKEKEEKNIQRKIQTPYKKNQLYKNNNIKGNILKNKNRSASSNQLKINKINDIKNINNYNNGKNKNEENNINFNKINKRPEEYGRKNILVEQLKNRIKYDPVLKYLEEEKKLYEKEQQEKKQRKILEQQNYLNDLKMQIEEKDKLKEKEKLSRIKDLEEI